MMRRHVYGWICDRCGARLDPGESCDCGYESEVTPVDRKIPQISMEQLERLRKGPGEIRLMQNEIRDLRLDASPEVVVTLMEKDLEQRRKQHAKDIAAVTSSLTRIQDELIRRVAWGYYMKGKSILTIAIEEKYSNEYIRQRLRRAENLMTGRA